MSEPKPIYQVEPGSNGTAAVSNQSATIPVTDGETWTEVSAIDTSPELRRLPQKNTKKPSQNAEPSEKQPAPVSPDLLWLLSRPFEQGREVAIFRGQSTLFMLDANMNPVYSELPDGHYAIVPISPAHIRLQKGEFRWIRKGKKNQ